MNDACRFGPKNGNVLTDRWSLFPTYKITSIIHWERNHLASLRTVSLEKSLQSPVTLGELFRKWVLGLEVLFFGILCNIFCFVWLLEGAWAHFKASLDVIDMSAYFYQIAWHGTQSISDLNCSTIPLRCNEANLILMFTTHCWIYSSDILKDILRNFVHTTQTLAFQNWIYSWLLEDSLS